MALSFDYSEKKIQDLVYLYEHGQINLDPPFQRDSVWGLNDRKRLIQSLVQGFPIPSLFLYERRESGHLVYDVIDGKQRLETIFAFQGLKGFKRERFTIKTRMNPDEDVEEWDWGGMRKWHEAHRIMGYKVQVTEVEGDLGDIIDLFVRINSTGKRLTTAEKRHARFFRSDFLRKADSLARRYQPYLIRNRILRASQIQRMKHVELMSELMAAIATGGPTDKKRGLDAILSGTIVDGRSLPRVVAETQRTLNRIEKMFPQLRTTRFANTVDFYSLALFIWDLERRGRVLTHTSRNKQAELLLIRLSDGVDEVRERVKSGKGTTAEQQLFRDYWLTVAGDTDSRATRKRREDLLNRVLGGVFERKDSQRLFTPEQRRLLWHAIDKKSCSSCGETLTWNNVTIDHVKPHSRGGRTARPNAVLMCRPCNSRKGARSRTRKGTRPRKRVRSVS